jgi:hypothetical protein
LYFIYEKGGAFSIKVDEAFVDVVEVTCVKVEESFIFEGDVVEVFVVVVFFDDLFEECGFSASAYACDNNDVREVLFFCDIFEDSSFDSVVFFKDGFSL